MGQKLTASQVATMAKRSKSQVNRDARAGRLPFEQQVPGYNGARLFERDDAEAYARAFTQAEGETSE